MKASEIKSLVKASPLVLLFYIYHTNSDLFKVLVFFFGLAAGVWAFYKFSSGKTKAPAYIPPTKKRAVSAPGDKRRKSDAANNLLCDVKKFVVLDTETTGLDKGAEVIEISVLDSDGNILLDTLVKPRNPIPQDAVDIHGITNKMVENAPTWDEIAPLYFDATRGHKIFAYNSSYDKRIIKQSCEIYGIKNTARKWGCVMLSYAWFNGDEGRRQNDYKWIKLTEAAKREGVRASGEAHRSLYDSSLTLGVIMAMKKHF